MGLQVSAQAGMVKAPFEGLPEIELSFDLDGKRCEWQFDTSSENEAEYICNGYRLKLILERTGIQDILRFSLLPPAGQQISVESYSARIILPIDGLHSVMVPNTRKIAHTLIYYHEHRTWPENPRIYRCLVPEGFEESASSNHEAPFILLTDDQGNNAFSVGWARADWASHLQGEGADGSYTLNLVRKEDKPFSGEVLEDALIISSAQVPWMDVEMAYAKTFDRYNNRPTREPAPAWTLEPVFCTWYCYDDHIDQDGVIRIATKCKELGFGTILIDAGWDAFPDMGFGDFEEGVLGDYTAMPDRFPDMAGLVKTLHDMGLRVELWAGPFWEGKKSRAYQEKTYNWHMRSETGEELHELCPRVPGLREHFRESFARVAKTYGIDGMWLDAADSVPPKCYADHEHLDQPMGEAFVDCVEAIRDGLRSVNPKAVTEGRVLHCNLHSKRAFDLVQPSDAPKSYEFLRLAGIHIRPWVYDILLKNDPMNWRMETDPVTVAKFLATMVCNGVPALSVDFLTAPEEHCLLTKAWLAFFQEHKDTLLNGEFILFGADYGSPDMMIVGDQEAVIYLQNPWTTEVALPRAVQKIMLLNCTNSDSVKLRISPSSGLCTVQLFDIFLNKLEDTSALMIDGAICLDEIIPQGGIAVIEPGTR